MTKNLLAWCSLLRASGVGSRTFFKILNIFSNPENFYQASEHEICALMPQVPREQWQKWRKNPYSGEEDLEWLAHSKANHIITFCDERYPKLLKHISDPPPVLFVKGNIENLSMPQLAVVGSRKATLPTLKKTEELCAELNENGLTITSGLALGVDAAAHRGALNAKGLTIAVVATGLDRVYPSQHRNLAYEILEKGGTFVSELYTGVGIRSENFPRRNRLISGITLGVLVMEAAEKSGSLITAYQALEQGREVFSFPSSINNPNGRGSNKLLREGAKMVENSADIFRVLAPSLNFQIKDLFIKESKKNTLQNLNLSDIEEKILNAIGFEACTIDDVVERTKISITDVSSTILFLELNGYLTTVSGGYLQRLV